MRTGLLWMTKGSNIDLSEQVSRAIRFYQMKYGYKPNICYVHPSLISQIQNLAEGVEIKVNKNLLPNYLWVGFITRSSNL